MTIAVRSANHGSTSSSTNAPSVNAPAGLAAGDVILACMGTTKNGPAVSTRPFAQVDTQTTAGTVTLAEVCEEIAGVAGSYAWLLNANSDWATVILAISGADQTSPVNAHNSSIATASTSCVCPTVTTTKAGCLIVEFVAQSRTAGNGPTFTAPGGSAVQDQAAATVAASNNAGVVVVTQNALSGAPGTYGGDTITSTASQNYAAFTLAIAPATSQRMKQVI